MRWSEVVIDWRIQQACVPYYGEDPDNRSASYALAHCRFCGHHTPLVWHPDGLFCPWHRPKEERDDRP